MRNEGLSPNPTRRLILNYILENPGVQFSHIHSFFGLSKGTVRYHLDQLERSRMVRKEKRDGRSCYYGTGETLEPPGIRNMSREQVRVFRMIRSSPGISHSRLLELSGLSKDQLRYHLKRLVRKGLVGSNNEGNEKIYRPVSENEVKKRVYIELVRRFLDGEIDEETFLSFSRKL